MKLDASPAGSPPQETPTQHTKHSNYFAIVPFSLDTLSQSVQRSPSPFLAGLKHPLSEIQADLAVSPLFQRLTRSGSQIKGRDRAM